MQNENSFFLVVPNRTAWLPGYLFYNSSPLIFDIVMSQGHSK